jgi:hypothetical protein
LTAADLFGEISPPPLEDDDLLGGSSPDSPCGFYAFRSWTLLGCRHGRVLIIISRRPVLFDTISGEEIHSVCPDDLLKITNEARTMISLLLSVTRCLRLLLADSEGSNG